MPRFWTPEAGYSTSAANTLMRSARCKRPLISHRKRRNFAATGDGATEIRRARLGAHQLGASIEAKCRVFRQRRGEKDPGELAALNLSGTGELRGRLRLWLQEAASHPSLRSSPGSRSGLSARGLWRNDSYCK